MAVTMSDAVYAGSLSLLEEKLAEVGKEYNEKFEHYLKAKEAGQNVEAQKDVVLLCLKDLVELSDVYAKLIALSSKIDLQITR